LVDYFVPYRENISTSHSWKSWAGIDAGDGEQRMPGRQSRWSQGKDLSWEVLRLELVVEVAYGRRVIDSITWLNSEDGESTRNQPIALTNS
jgi:hypothetical protein